MVKRILNTMETENGELFYLDEEGNREFFASCCPIIEVFEIRSFIKKDGKYHGGSRYMSIITCDDLEFAFDLPENFFSKACGFDISVDVPMYGSFAHRDFYDIQLIFVGMDGQLKFQLNNEATQQLLL